MTPVELNVYARAYKEQLMRKQRLQEANIFSLATLIRSMVWSKHPPDFDRAFPEKPYKKKQNEMTDDQMYAVVVGLNALFGGKEVG